MSPLAVSGLLAHSIAIDEPYERLARTARVLSTLGSGSKRDADRVAAKVRAMHRRVRGRLKYPGGYRKYVGRLSADDAARLWDDYRVIRRLFRLRERPPRLAHRPVTAHRREQSRYPQPPDRLPGGPENVR